MEALSGEKWQRFRESAEYAVAESTLLGQGGDATGARERLVRASESRSISPQVAVALADALELVGGDGACGGFYARARAGLGPSLIEARTYRYHDHSEGLNRVVRDPYRSEEEIEEWRGRDPIAIHEERLAGQGIATAEEVAALEAECKAAIDEALQFAQESPYPEPDEIFDDVYTNPIAIERS